MNENNNCTTESSSANLPLMDYELLSNLFLYPKNEGYKNKLQEIYQYLQNSLPEAADALKRFVDFTEVHSFVDAQELFLRSFDLQAITTLDIGFILFGEDYKRGKLLVNLNEEHRNAGNDCEAELADHLPNLLRLLPKMKDLVLRDEIASLLILPAVVRMLKEFSPEKIEKKDAVYKKHQKVILDFSENHRTVYQNCLQALFLALTHDFEYIPQEETGMNRREEYSDPGNPTSIQTDTPEKDFQQNIETEMIIENK